MTYQVMIIEAIKITSNELHELYKLNNQSSEQVFSLLPKYFIEKNNTVYQAKYKLYYVPSTPVKIDTQEEEYVLFDVKYQDSLLEFETSNDSLEDVVKDSITIELLKNFNILSYKEWRDKLCPDTIKLVFDIEYETYYDDYHGVHESECFTKFIGYLSNEDLKLHMNKGVLKNENNME